MKNENGSQSSVGIQIHLAHLGNRLLSRFNWIYDLSLTKKFAFAFLIVISVPIAVNIYGNLSIRAIERNIDHLHEAALLVDSSMQSQYAIARDMQLIMEMLESTSENELQGIWAQHLAFIEEFENCNSRIVELLQVKLKDVAFLKSQNLSDSISVYRTMHRDKFIPVVKSIFETQMAYLKHHQKLSKVKQEIGVLDNSADALGEQLIAGYDYAIEEFKTGMEHLNMEAAQTTKSAEITVLFGVLLSLVVATVLSFVFIRLLAHPIIKAVEKIKEIAAGHIRIEKLDKRSHDEIGQLADACNQMITNLGYLADKAAGIAAGRLGAKEMAAAVAEGETIETAAQRLATAEMASLQGDLATAFKSMLIKLKIFTLQAQLIAGDQLEHEALQARQDGDLGGAFTAMLAKLNGLANRAEDIAAGKLNADIVESALEKGKKLDEAALVKSEQSGCLTDAFDKMQTQLRMLTVQARSIARDELNAKALNFEIGGELGDAFRDMVAYLKMMAQRMNAIAAGDLSNEILQQLTDSTGTEKVLAASMQKNVLVLRSLLSSVEQLIEGAKAGKLTVRAEVNEFFGAYRDLCQGMNDMLAAVAAPINDINTVLTQVAANNLTVSMDQQYAGIFKVLQQSLNRTIDNLRKNIANIAHNAQGLASSAEEFSNISAGLAKNAEDTAEQSTGVSSASEQITMNVKSVASATSQMTASIKEITTNTSQAAEIAGEAASRAGNASKVIDKLGESSSEIEQVIKIISDIAAQTRLLALNATIESAHAGDAGKGFAVVASEVKQLADQTANSTVSIREKIEKLQSETSETVTVISDVSNIINQIDSISTTIASAIEEQAAATADIQRSIDEAAAGVNEISENIVQVADAAANTREGAGNTQVTSKELTKMAVELQTLVEQFTY